MNARDKYLKNCADAYDVFDKIHFEAYQLCKASWTNDLHVFDELYEITRDTAYEAYKVSCAEYLREFEIARNIARDVYELEASNLTNQKGIKKNG